MITSEIKLHGGVPSLFVNGEVIPANAYNAKRRKQKGCIHH